MDAYALRINNTGSLIWKWMDGFLNTDDSYNSVVLSKKTPGNSVYAQTETFTGFGIHIKIMELNSGGFYTNATEYGGILADEILKMSNTLDKGYVGTGYTNNYNAKLTDVFLLKMDSNIVGSNSIVSIREDTKNEFEFSVYPNPASDEFRVKSSVKIKSEDLKLYDIMGNEVFINDKIDESVSNLKILNIEKLSRGVYFLKIHDTTEKISIIH
jgi:hypothetical protein